jgi:hypothetical protein
MHARRFSGGDLGLASYDSDENGPALECSTRRRRMSEDENGEPSQSDHGFDSRYLVVAPWEAPAIVQPRLDPHIQANEH